MLRTIQTVFVILGLLLAFGGIKLSIPYFLDGGMVCLGVACIAIGWEAILTKHIVIGSRRHGIRQSYRGIPAMLQGVQFNVMGLFLMAVAAMMYFNTSPRVVGVQIAQHPGLLLIVVGCVILTQAVIVFLGSGNPSDSASEIGIMGVLFLRLLPGLILTILGVALLGLGIFEILAPNAFDAMGGGFLEGLYGLK